MAHWPLYIDMPWGNILSAAYRGITWSLPERQQLQKEVENLFGGCDGYIACTSVRSAFDLFLCAMNFPKGSDIILTAVNIPDMCSIVEEHGLNIVPVDIDLETLAPKEELVELAITNKTVAILVAHIYGKWINMDAVTNIARANSLFVLEDCAECFEGFERQGHHYSDVTFFSFGLIKYYTCFGGAISVVRKKELHMKMRSKLETYPVQSHGFFLKKLIKYAMLAFLLNSSSFVQIATPVFDAVGFDYKEFFIAMLRGYPEQLMSQLRYQPSAALLKMMLDRLSDVRQRDFEVAKIKGDFVKDRLPKNVFVPGQKSDRTNYWLFPVIVDDPHEVMKALEKDGVQAYHGATQLRTVYRTQGADADDAAVDDKGLAYPHPNSTDVDLYTKPELAAGISQSDPTGHDYREKLDLTTQQSCSGTTMEYSTPSVKEGSHQEPRRAHQDILYPYNAEYLIKHVLYLPVHRNVPLWYLEKICIAMKKVMRDRVGVSFKNGQNIAFSSKL